MAVQNCHLVKTALRLLAAIVILGAPIYWAAKGANRGWTKTLVPVKITDDVTGIEGITYQKKFVPGLDFLAAAMGIGIVAGGASFLFRTKRSSQPSNVQKNKPLS
jgi:hypothetical protein